MPCPSYNQSANIYGKPQEFQAGPKLDLKIELLSKVIYNLGLRGVHMR